MPNWGKLKAQGRCKDIGVPWTEEEAVAVASGVPAEYVRRGALTAEEADEMRAADEAAEAKTGELPVEAMDSGQLRAKAEELGVEITHHAPDSVMRELINAKLASTKKASKKAPAKKAATASKKASKTT